jgi:hypothetical protein
MVMLQRHRVAEQESKSKKRRPTSSPKVSASLTKTQKHSRFSVRMNISPPITPRKLRRVPLKIMGGYSGYLRNSYRKSSL